MRYLKMLGLAAISIAAVMAFVGAGTASAGVLCSEDVTICPAAQQWSVGAEMSFSLKAGTSGVLKDTNNLQTETCSAISGHGTVTDNGATSGVPAGSVAATGVTFASCTHTGTHAPHVYTGGTLKIDRKSNTEGTVTGEGFVVTVWNTSLSVTCNYTAGSGLSLGDYKADATGKDGVVTINTTINRTTEHSGSIFCPSTSVLTGEATYTGTTPLFISEQ